MLFIMNDALSTLEVYNKGLERDYFDFDKL